MGYTTREKNLFTKENIRNLKKCAIAIVLYTVCVLCLKFFENWGDIEILERYDGKGPFYEFGFVLGHTIGEALRSQMPLILLALFFFMLWELANDGYQLKQEHDLTI